MSNAKLDKITKYINTCINTCRSDSVSSSTYDDDEASMASIESMDKLLIHLTGCNDCKQRIKNHNLLTHNNGIDINSKAKESLMFILMAIIGVIFLDVFVRFINAKD